MYWYEKAAKKIFINNMITYCMVIAAWLIMQFMISEGIFPASPVKGTLRLLVFMSLWLCPLNLTVGILES